jgi:hypothetical protein
MDTDAYDELLRRLTALVVKLDERDDQFAAQLEELREFNRQQVLINTRLETLMARVFQERHNGQDG